MDVVAYIYKGRAIQIMTAGCRRENVLDGRPQFGHLDWRAKGLSNRQGFRPKFPHFFSSCRFSRFVFPSIGMLSVSETFPSVKFLKL